MTSKLTPHFTVQELRCRCGRPACDATPMKPAFMAKLEAARVDYGTPLSPTSGTRCKVHNKAQGGANGSQHVKGNAADFNFRTEADGMRFVACAERAGLRGIGYGWLLPNLFLVHVDDRLFKARWRYGA